MAGLRLERVPPNRLLDFTVESVTRQEKHDAIPRSKRKSDTSRVAPCWENPSRRTFLPYATRVRSFSPGSLQLSFTRMRGSRLCKAKLPTHGPRHTVKVQ